MSWSKYILLALPFSFVASSCCHEAQSGTPASTEQAASTPVQTASMQPAFDISGIFQDAEYGLLPANPNADKIVCLGEQVSVLDMDSLQRADPGFVAPSDAPQILNKERVMNSMPTHVEGMKGGKVKKAVAKVLVDEMGHVIRFQVLESPNEAVTGDLEKHLEELRFKPGMRDGHAAKWWVILPFFIGQQGC